MSPKFLFKKKERVSNNIFYLSATIFLIGLLLFCAGSCFKHKSKSKILLICLDGATWNLINPLLERKELPNFRKLIENGASGILYSGEAYSPPCWTSIATGKDSGKHGVHDFSGSSHSKVKYLWDIVSAFGIKVGVLNWLKSSCRKINGFMYKFSFYHPDFFCCYPELLREEIGKMLNINKLPDRESVENYKYFDMLDKNTNNLNMFLINKFKPSFLAIGFMVTNPYQHRYWSALEPQYFDISRAEVIEKGSIITDYYKKIDKLLNYFIKRNYTVIFVSDHGFCRNDIRSGPRIIKYKNINSDMQHVNFLMDVLLEKLDLLIFIPKLEYGGQIDFSKSKAFFYNNIEKGVSGIKINRKVVEQKDIMSLRQRILTALKEAHFETGERVFLDVEEKNADERLDLPDIMFKLSAILKEKNISLTQDRQIPLNITSLHVFNEKRKELFTLIIEGKEYSLEEFINYSRDGVHEQEGVIIMAGRNIKKNVQVTGAKLCDITPTILYLLGLPVAKDMDGTVLFKAIEPGFIQKHPIKFIETYENKQADKDFLSNVTNESEIDKEQLRSLGYAQ